MNVLCKLLLWSSLCCLPAKQSQVMGPSSSAATGVTQASLDRFAIEASADWHHRRDNNEAGTERRTLSQDATHSAHTGLSYDITRAIPTAGQASISDGDADTLGGLAHAVSTLEERELPMRFTWVACQPNCRGWVSAVGIVTAATRNEFDDFARVHQLGGATIVLDSSGGSVNDAIALGRRWRDLGILTTVGTSIDANGDHADIAPQAYCDSMCVFLLLSGKVRYVPDGAHVRVHQIWMGDRANDAKAASYSAHDMTIVERDIGRLAKYTFDMGGGGDLLSLALSVPPWEDLHELSPAELRLTNLVTTDAVDGVLLPNDSAASVAEASAKLSEAVSAEIPLPAAKSTKTAEATAPTGGVGASSPAQPQR
jgi:hypothetical protein